MVRRPTGDRKRITDRRPATYHCHHRPVGLRQEHADPLSQPHARSHPRRAVILMDEPCSALDPIATYRIEELMSELKRDYTIAIVTHNMQQASRVSDYTAFMLAEADRIGRLVEFGPTASIFTNPSEKRTEDYITGRFG